MIIATLRLVLLANCGISQARVTNSSAVPCKIQKGIVNKVKASE
ncbi:Uncharacterised protein [Streptococcus pneumoniae]|nr:Uncharacterised protein [Streptococcus pneumoniae]